MKSLFLSIAVTGLALCRASAAGLAESEPAASLSFAQAWSRVQQHNPRLAAARQDVMAADSSLIQAGALPNPQVSLESENFGGSRQAARWDEAENTLKITQPLETGGKRQARKAEARAGKALSQASLELHRLELWATLAESYTEALASREKQALAEDDARLARERRDAVAARVQAGKAPPQEEKRASVEAEMAQAALETAKGQATLAQHRLAALWGQPRPVFRSLEGRLDTITEMKLPDPIAETNAIQPDLILAQREYSAREAALKREQSQARPNVELSAGIRHFESGGGYAWQGEIAFPLPLFDRNRGGIQKARHELESARHLQQATLLNLTLEQDALTTAAETQWRTITVLRDRALPAARDAMQTTKTGYESGKFSYLDWVDSERSFVSLRSQWIDTLAAYHKTLAALGRLTGNTDSFTLFQP
ncbi:MAG: TolC family protein [bacterium]